MLSAYTLRAVRSHGEQTETIQAVFAYKAKGGLLCYKRRSFTLQKATFHNVKGGLTQHALRPYATQGDNPGMPDGYKSKLSFCKTKHKSCFIMTAKHRCHTLPVSPMISL